MHSEKLTPEGLSAAGVSKSAVHGEQMHAHGSYRIECRDRQGCLKWCEDFDNLVTTVGKNDALDKYFAGSAYTPTWYVGLISITDYVAGVAASDTMASHAGWAEDQNYSQSARPTAAWASANAGAKALSAAAVFTINADTTIKGCFLTTVATKGGITGVLYSAGLFTLGDKVIQSGDTLNVSYTASL